MKNKIWKTIKTKRFLYALLTAVLLYAFAVGSARLWQWLILWRGLEIVVWFGVYVTVLYKTIMAFAKWQDKH